jgi:hypothetical protein
MFLGMDLKVSQLCHISMMQVLMLSMELSKEIAIQLHHLSETYKLFWKTNYFHANLFKRINLSKLI